MENLKVNYTMLSTFLTCGEQFRWRYCEGVLETPSLDVVRGKVIHHAVKLYNANRILSKEMKLEEFTDLALEQWHLELQDGYRVPSGEDEKALLEKYEASIPRICKVYYETLAPSFEPMAVEKHIVDTIEIVDSEQIIRVTIEGIIDMLDKENCVRDLKVAKRKYGEDEAHRRLQFDFYKLLLPNIEKFCLDIVVITDKKEEVQQLYTSRDNASVEALKKTLLMFIKANKAGLFIPRPATTGMSWWCSEDYCSYFGHCEYVKK